MKEQGREDLVLGKLKIILTKDGKFKYQIQLARFYFIGYRLCLLLELRGPFHYRLSNDNGTNLIVLGVGNAAPKHRRRLCNFK